MNWKIKNAAFWILSWIPAGRFIHSVAQRFVTRRYFPQLTPDLLAAYQRHVVNFRLLPAGSAALEFGVGQNMLTPLLLSAAGASVVYAYDIERIATIQQINAVIAQLRALMPGHWPLLERIEDLAPLYRIQYRAPGDARATMLPAGSVDFICSTSVLEHVPAADIREILEECVRIASANALLSFIVDYHDHYATGDQQISRFNFYRYSAKRWRLFNPPMQYQNRLRHSDYCKLLAAFEPIGVECIIPREIAVDVPLAPEFVRYTGDDLLALNGFFLLRPPKLRPAPVSGGVFLNDTGT